MQGIYGPAGREDQNTHLHFCPAAGLTLHLACPLSSHQTQKDVPHHLAHNAHFHLPKAPALSEMSQQSYSYQA